MDKKLHKKRIPWNKGINMWKDKQHPKGALGKKFSIETRNKMSIAKKNMTEQNRINIGLGHIGKKHSTSTIKKLSLAKIGNKNPNFGKIFSEEHRKKIGLSRYIIDRTKLKKNNTPDRRLDYAMIDWRKNVYKRDNYKCKINNNDCVGRIEAHHILRWKDYPELRYDVNNGITLCHAHHPRKKIEELNMSTYFMDLILTTNK